MAVRKCKKLSADEEARVRAEYEEMMRRDYVSRINGAKREGLVEVAKRMKAEDLDAALISKITGLTEDEIKRM
jgi:predicted transposase YdaD